MKDMNIYLVGGVSKESSEKVNQSAVDAFPDVQTEFDAMLSEDRCAKTLTAVSPFVAYTC